MYTTHVPEHVPENLDQVDELLRALGAVERQRGAIEARMNNQLDRIRADAARDDKPLHERSAALVAALKKVAQKARKSGTLFKRRRSVELRFGRIGFQRSTELTTMPAVKWADVLDRLKGGLAERDPDYKLAIRVKESPNKDVLRTWGHDRLAEVGCRWRDKETFYVETAAEQIDHRTGTEG